MRVMVVVAASVAVLCSSGCGIVGGEITEATVEGARQGDSFALTEQAPTRTFDVRLCADWLAERTERNVEFQVMANVRHPGPSTLTVEIDASGSPGPESFEIRDRTRVESIRFHNPGGPEAACRDGVSVTFTADPAPAEPMELDWEIDYIFGADHDWGHGAVVKIYSD